VLGISSGGVPSFANDTERDAYYVAPNPGDRAYRRDMLWVEEYRGSRSFTTTTATRTSPAGWYPVDGAGIPILRAAHTYTGATNATWNQQTSLTVLEQVNFANLASGAWVVPIDGYYAVRASQGVTAGGDDNDSVRLEATANSVSPPTGTIADVEWRVTSTRGTQGSLYNEVPLQAGDQVRFYLLAGGLQFQRSDAAFYQLRYIRPI
jgi:hypothetical protein